MAGLQEMYPAVFSAYRSSYKKTALSPEIWGMFHDLHLLQTARDESEVQDAVWALHVLACAMSKADSRRSAEMAKALIRVLPSKEHEAWYKICKDEGHLDAILASHPRARGAATEPARAAKTALAVGVMLQDFQGRCCELKPWQRVFLYKEVGPKCAEVFREARQVLDILNQDAFCFMLSKQLVRGGNCPLALKLLRQTPAADLAGTTRVGEPLEEHSYFELYTQLLVYGGAADLFGFLEHFVKLGAYSDDALLTFLRREELKEAMAFIVNYVSFVRMQQFGVDGAASKEPKKGSWCRMLLGGGRSDSLKSPLRTANVPHVLLRHLLDRYIEADDSGKEHLLHNRAFQQAFEIVLLLGEGESARAVDRLGDKEQEALKTCLRVWTRLHFLRVLERNKPPVFDARPDAVKLNEPWIWTPSEQRSNYFKSAARNSADIAAVLRTLFQLGMILDPTILQQLLNDAASRNQPLDIVSDFLPEGSVLCSVISAEVCKHTAGLVTAEVKELMRVPGFYEPGIQGFLRGGGADGPRAIFREDGGFVRLMRAVAKLSGFKNGHMDRSALEGALGQIAAACHGESACCELVARVVEATLRKSDKDFLPPGAADRDSDPSAFTVAGLALCARRLREACDTVKNGAVQLTFGRVVEAFLDTPPRGWVALFNSLETVLFFLRFMEREDLSLAYERFESENQETFAADPSLRKLLSRARKYYKEPFIDVEQDVTELCNLDLRTKMSKRLLPCKKKGDLPEQRFDNGDWNAVVEIALCAAESMKEKYNVPMLPHHTQMITLLMFAVQVCQGAGAAGDPSGAARTLLARVGTGEGKSWIIGMLAAFVAKRGYRAHVVIDNDTLLERDYATMAALFKKLKLSAEKRKLDQDHQIVYCSAMDIELHSLRSMRDSENELDFSNCIMIVDEVDSLIVDENVYRCYVDVHEAGSEVCEWWWDQGRYENPQNFPQWKRNIMQNLVSAERELKTKKDGKHYFTDHNMGTFWALDEKTCQVKRAIWYLWLELLRKKGLVDYTMNYSTRQSVMCKQSCFASYSLIFGLTGSLGTEAEKRFTKRHFKASHFFVPNFLDTCRNQSRPKPRCVLTEMQADSTKQRERTAKVACDYCASVPVLIVARDPDRVQEVAAELRRRLPVHAAGDRLGPGVIELLDRPGREGEFQQMVEAATQPLQPTDGAAKRWRVTVTTAVGARGQDYHVADELVDEKGGFMLVLEYVPDSEREWIQFLGRTARHDHPGQYAVVLNVQDYRDVFGFDGAPETGAFVHEILAHAGKKTEEKLVGAEEQIARGTLMHEYTSLWWRWSRRHKEEKDLWEETFGQWVELCEKFESKSPQEITADWEAMNLQLTPRPKPAPPVPVARAVRSSPATARERDGGDEMKFKGINQHGDTPVEEADLDDDDIFAPRKRPLDDVTRKSSTRSLGQSADANDGSRSARAEGLAALAATPRSCLRMKGDGRRILPDGRVYEGQFEQGKMSGKGQLKWPAGQIYVGEFRDDMLAGVGTLSWPDGRSYAGQWQQNKQHGTGTYVDAQGVSWKETWVNGSRTERSPVPAADPAGAGGQV
eukprot:TRINITY_DN9251_c0_g3_i1.p1 TRINITY_DN9251_c0_g3~~TRINITY_DN9251_c0_g3_i1.p1  ORF type:complete len:1563 (+),score=249.83 TRINITY_DN9251_c0_g3_i1:91-4779(+)